MNRIGLFVISLLVLLMVLSSTLFIVDQRQFAVVYSLGQIKEIINEPGLKFKLPQPVQNVAFLDRRIQTLDGPDTMPIATAEKSSLVVDWLVKWRLIDPTAFIRANGGTDIRGFESRLVPVVQSAFNEEITRRTVQDMVAKDREGVMRDVKASITAQVKAKGFGIEIIDVRIKRVDFPAKITSSVYDRMKSERTRVANQERATGKAEAVRISADADRQRAIILAEAYREAQSVKGEGDAKAAALYAEAYSKDAQFANFYRSLEAYKTTFRNKSDMMVIDPESDFFKAMRGSGSGGGGSSKK